MVDVLNADLGESNVVPVPTREFRPEPFTPTKSEWAADNREVVIDNIRSSGALFTVPNNKILYITHIYLSGSQIAAANANASISIDGKRILRLFLGALTGTTDSGHLAFSFTMPIKVRQNVTFNNGISNAEGGFVGYLE